MLDAPMLDPVGALVSELRADVDLDLLTDGRVSAGEAKEGYALGPGRYQAFVVITGAVGPHPSAPISTGTLGVRCYGSTYQNAGAVWGAVVKALHKVGPRVKVSGLGIYRTALLPDAAQSKDPDTGQPYIDGTISIIATAQALA